MSGEISQVDIHVAKLFFDTYIYGNMIHDIEVAMNGNAPFLAALGLVTYTEILGGFATGNLGIKRTSTSNFKYFITEYMEQSYSKFIKQSEFDIYERVRCGIVHDYFIKKGKNKGGSFCGYYENFYSCR